MALADLWDALGAVQKASPHAGLWVAGGFGALLLSAHLLGQKRQPQTSHGTARWATPSEIAGAGFTAPHGVVCARLGRQLLCDDGETHVALVAPSRAGKGVGPIMGSLFTWLHSVLVYDPANGENYDATHAWRVSLGHRVERYTPRGSPNACINVCDLIRFGKPQEREDALTIGASLVAPMKVGRQSDAGVYFRNNAKRVIAAGLLHLHYAEPPVSLGKLNAFLTQRYPTLKQCLTAMAQYRHTAHGVHPSVLELAESGNRLSDRSEGDTWGTLMGALEPYGDYLVQRSTDTSTITIDALQHSETPMSLYLVSPSTRSLETQAPVYRSVGDMIQYRLQQYAPRTAEQRLLVIADEAPAFGYSSFLDKGPAEAAKYGIKFLIVAQDTVQLNDTFGKDNSIFGNTATKIFFAPDSHETAKALSQAWGQATVEQPVLTKPQGLGGKTSVSYQQVGKWHMTPDQLRTMHKQACVIDHTGLYPILAGKVNCRIDPEFVGKYQASAA